MSTWGSDSISLKVELGGAGVAGDRRAVEHHAIGVGEAQRADFAGHERLDMVGMRLGHEAGGVDRAVKQHHDALAGRLRGEHGADRVQVVERPVPADCAPGSHRTNDNHRFVRLDRELEEIGRFLQSRGSVGDDRTGDVRPLQLAHDPSSEVQLLFGTHVAAADRRDLFHLDPRQLGGLGHVFDHRLAVDAPVAVFVELQAIRPKAPNRAAGGEELDHGQLCRLAGGSAHQSDGDDSLSHPRRDPPPAAIDTSHHGKHHGVARGPIVVRGTRGVPVRGGAVENEARVPAVFDR